MKLRVVAHHMESITLSSNSMLLCIELCKYELKTDKEPHCLDKTSPDVGNVKDVCFLRLLKRAGTLNVKFYFRAASL